MQNIQSVTAEEFDMSTGVEKVVSDYLLRWKITSDNENERAIKELEALTDRYEAGERDLEPLIDYISGLIVKYEDEHYPVANPSPVDMLVHLMENHQHSQKDLQDVASQSVISEILSGKRDLNLRHIRKLSEKYGVSPEVFI